MSTVVLLMVILGQFLSNTLSLVTAMTRMGWGHTQRLELAKNDLYVYIRTKNENYFKEYQKKN